jgi:phage-related minor tail protein
MQDDDQRKNESRNENALKLVKFFEDTKSIFMKTNEMFKVIDLKLNRCQLNLDEILESQTKLEQKIEDLFKDAVAII